MKEKCTECCKRMENGITLKTKNGDLTVPFCSYDCYINFFKKAPKFKPFPENKNPVKPVKAQKEKPKKESIKKFLRNAFNKKEK